MLQNSYKYAELKSCSVLFVTIKLDEMVDERGNGNVRAVAIGTREN